MINYRIVVILSVLLAWACPSRAGDEVELAPRPYMDKFRGGFSLRPPVNTERTQEPSPSRLVGWLFRDAKSGAVAWQINVLRATEKNPVDLKTYSGTLVDKLKQEQAMDVGAVQITTVGGKSAIEIQGVVVGLVPQWQRQVWVLTNPNRFLIFMISGPPDMKAQLLKIHQAVLDTVKIVDPQEAAAEQAENLKRGREFLTLLTDAKLQSVADESRWYLLRIKGEPVGWMAQIETVKERDKTAGVEIRTIASITIAGQERLQRRLMFTGNLGRPQGSPEDLPPQLREGVRICDRWDDVLTVTDPNTKITFREQGLKQGEFIVCTASQGAKNDTLKKKVPVDIYLPRVAGLMLPRLLDLTKPGAYAFAVYNGQINDFEPRTVTVGEKETIKIGGRDVSCVHVAEVVGGQTETAVDSWVDASGKLLRTQGADGFLMNAATRDEVTAKYPQAPAQLEELRK